MPERDFLREALGTTFIFEASHVTTGRAAQSPDLVSKLLILPLRVAVRLKIIYSSEDDDTFA